MNEVVKKFIIVKYKLDPNDPQLESKINSIISELKDSPEEDIDNFTEEFESFKKQQETVAEYKFGGEFLQHLKLKCGGKAKRKVMPKKKKCTSC